MPPRAAHTRRDRVAERVIAVRRRFPHFGPKKAWLKDEGPKVE
jgi:hypothetical protein